MNPVFEEVPEKKVELMVISQPVQKKIMRPKPAALRNKERGGE